MIKFNSKKGMELPLQTIVVFMIIIITFIIVIVFFTSSYGEGFDKLFGSSATNISRFGE